jgi:hypothetical protein
MYYDTLPLPRAHCAQLYRTRPFGWPTGAGALSTDHAVPCVAPAAGVPGSRPRDKASLHITHSITHIITEPATRPCRPGLIGPPGLARIDRRKGSTSKAFSRSFNILLSHRSSWRRTGRVSSQLSVERLAVRPHAQAPVRRRPTTHRRARLRKLDANASVGSRSRSREVLKSSTRTNPVTSPTRLATEQLVCTCNRCLPPGGSRPL